MITQNQINEVVQRIAVGYDPDKILLFGSYALNSANENSDLDIIVIKNSNQPIHKRIYEVKMLLLDITYPVDIIVYTSHEIDNDKNRKFSFIYNVLKTSKVVYERCAGN